MHLDLPLDWKLASPSYDEVNKSLNDDDEGGMNEESEYVCLKYSKLKTDKL